MKFSSAALTLFLYSSLTEDASANKQGVRRADGKGTKSPGKGKCPGKGTKSPGKGTKSPGKGKGSSDVCETNQPLTAVEFCPSNIR